jgi:cell division control protein 6
MPTDDAPADPAPTDDRNTLFDYTDAVFDDEDLLEIGHLPDPERIVGRDEHMQKVADALNPAIFGSAPSHLFIFGKTGTGKTLISRSVTEMLRTEADREGVTVEYAFVDCGEKNTEASVVKRVAQSLNEPERTEFTVPERGLATGDYYERLWTVLDSCTDVAIVILDEIDMLEDDEVLRKLSRASENRRIDSSRVGVIGISNKIDYPDQMSERVKSSFSRDELVFPPLRRDPARRDTREPPGRLPRRRPHRRRHPARGGARRPGARRRPQGHRHPPERRSHRQAHGRRHRHRGAHPTGQGED